MTPWGCPRGVSCRIRRDFSRLSGCGRQVAYVLLTRAPVAGRCKQAYFPAAPRLACVKPVASVHPEPGSNSPLLLSLFFFFLCQSRMNRHLKRSFRIPTASERHCFPADNLESKRWSNLTETSSVDRLAPGPRPLFSCTTSSIAIISMCSVLNVRPKLGGNVLQSYNQFLKPANL